MKKNLRKAVVGLICIGTILTTGVGVFAQTKDSNSIYIDARVSSSERSILYDVMSTLDPEDRENVIYMTEEGELYSNKPELKKDFKVSRNIASLDNKAVYPGTGAYRKVESNKGYSWINNKVFLPGNGTNVYMNYNANSKDTGYVYTGGRAKGVEVDAGFQHSSSLDDWAPFLSINGNRVSTDAKRMKPNQEVELKFYCNADDKVTLAVTGIDVTGSKKQYTIVGDAAGWTKNGANNVLKRCTTIAQKEPYENLSSGSYMKNVKWSDCYIGTNSTSASKWSSSHGFISEQYPTSSSKVSVDYTNQAQEIISINLK